MITEPSSTQSVVTALASVKVLYHHLLSNKLFVPNKKLQNAESQDVSSQVRAYSCNGNGRCLPNVTSLYYAFLLPYPCEALQPCSPENTTVLLPGTSHAVFGTTFAWPWDWHLPDLFGLGLPGSARSFALTSLGGKTYFLTFRWLQPDLYLNNFVENSSLLQSGVTSHFSQDKNIRSSVMM